MDDRTQRIDRAEAWAGDPDEAPEPRGAHIGPLSITPLGVVLAVALVGSLLYLAFALTVRDASQVPLLASGFAILGLVLITFAFLGARSTYRLASDGRNGPAFGLAIVGGLAAMVGFGCLAGAIVLALVWRR